MGIGEPMKMGASTSKSTMACHTEDGRAAWFRMAVATLLGATMLLGSGCGRGWLSSWSERVPVRGQDGNDNWWQIRCHRDDAGCLHQAAEACPDGYEVHDKDKRKYLLIQCQGRTAERVKVASDD